MPIELPIQWIIILNLAGWAGIQMGLAWLFTRLPLSWFHPAPPFRWERGGGFYERVLLVKRWKHFLPDGSSWFSGGFAKASLTRSHPDYLRRFLRETWRGELCHWTAIACVPLFFLWNPWWGNLIIVSYALIANLPCIVAQRYNRVRIERVLARVATGQ